MQTSIPRSGQPRAIAGLVGDTRDNVIVSAFNSEVATVIGYGLGVVNPGTERQARLPAGGADIFMGVTVFELGHQPDTGGFDLVSGASGGIKPKGALKVLREGAIWVVCDPNIGAVTPYSDRAHLRHTVNGAANKIGAFVNVADGGNTIDLTKLIVFVSPVITAADGVTKIALVEIEATVKP